MRIYGQLRDTSVGRALLSDIIPPEVPFGEINQTMNKKQIAKLIDKCFRLSDAKTTAIMADHLMITGFHYSTLAGISICLDDMVIPESKTHLLKDADVQVKEIQAQYDEGLITDGERYNKVVDIWAQTGDKVAKQMQAEIEKQEFNVAGKKVRDDSFNSIFVMADSGARGSAAQLRQLAGMRGLMAKPSGKLLKLRSRRTSGKGFRFSSILFQPMEPERVWLTRL